MKNTRSGYITYEEFLDWDGKEESVDCGDNKFVSISTFYSTDI